jgi:heme/copper-type cytochrome/quinol oxidase subunit 4
MDRGDRALVAWWALLVALTFLSFESGITGSQGAGFAATLVIIVALIKIRVVVMHFMEVKYAPLSLRGPLEVWIIVLGVTILAVWHGLIGYASSMQ